MPFCFIFKSLLSKYWKGNESFFYPEYTSFIQIKVAEDDSDVTVCVVVPEQICVHLSVQPVWMRKSGRLYPSRGSAVSLFVVVFHIA